GGRSHPSGAADAECEGDTERGADIAGTVLGLGSSSLAAGRALDCVCLMLRSGVITSDDPSPLPCRHDQAGCSPRRATYFFCFAKKSRQKKAIPVIAPRCRGGPEPATPVAGRGQTRSTQTDAAPYPLQA